MTNKCLRIRAEMIDPGSERFPDLRAGSTAGMDSFVRARALTIRASDALALLFALATLASPACTPRPPSDLKQATCFDTCSSHVCLGNSCLAPSCSDGVQNGIETDIDCEASPAGSA